MWFRTIVSLLGVTCVGLEHKNNLNDTLFLSKPPALLIFISGKM